MSEIYLIRHGQASFGQDNYDMLSEVGQRQAEIIAASLFKKGRIFDAIYCGGMSRQIQTAGALLNIYRKNSIPVPEIIKLDSFNEYDSEAVIKFQVPGLIEDDPSLFMSVDQIMNDKKAFQVIFEKAMRRWTSGNYDPPAAPRWQDFKYRVREGLFEIMRQNGAGKTLAVFTSGGPISIAIQAALELSDEKTMEVSWQIMNASISRFKYSGTALGLAGFNEIGHLESENDESLLTYR